MKRFAGLMILLLFIFSGCTSKDWFDNEDTYLIAHRGAHIGAPENTIESISQAANLGYDGVEIDVRESKDGTNFLMHNKKLDKTTNGKGKLENHTNKYLKNLKINTSEYPKYKNKELKIPTFKEAVKQISQENLIVNVDGSKGDWEDNKFIESIVDTLKKYDVYERSFFVLSDKNIRDEFVESYPDATVSWLYDPKDSIDEEIQQVKDYECALLSITDDIATESMLNKLNETEIVYQVYNVNNDERFKELESSDVPIVETDEINPDDL
ncbi:glycerophosphodiester phosphodiesterase family protein [Tetragenococcus koreensis]|uniref:glycerophosphodiester phosphodiesterase family protein n=1 Tax=Tetragenococcus koreensis TaxID=290335 RepID=UPI000F4EAB4F|nr:glycerophosphodiester phosphodiesterase family protein [Tetragenococcus koreensis]AYW45300.1 glycerophosphodiester phosphodiesterase [Tetragenococcus koreensis]MCF1620850.1 glycerophosphodiester phosphodiesterase family protein [Tetragenococcus koreensis]MCF1658364.1 glycerophosphodiester phosphodiesterase family protein [Tetragenococcus koreensis]GEN92357.1 glycerophosphoryl diester phosphodiesterase [Tetragenococcus koreensis]